MRPQPRTPPLPTAHAAYPAKLLVVLGTVFLLYCLAGLVVFVGFTILDFNRLRRANMGSAVPIAAGIFLDIFNVFLFMLSLFGGGGNRR